MRAVRVNQSIKVKCCKTTEISEKTLKCCMELQSNLIILCEFVTASNMFYVSHSHLIQCLSKNIEAALSSKNFFFWSNSISEINLVPSSFGFNLD